MAVTYHYINEEFAIVSGILDFVNINGKHEGKKLAASLVYLFKEYGLEKSQVLTITVDNASNNSTMIDEMIQAGYLDSPEHHIRCFAHVLNLVAQAMLGFISDLVKQLRINNKFIRNSPQRLEQFLLICKINNEDFNKPQLDAKTRWNSTYNMILVNLKMKKSMDEFISKQGQETSFEEEIGDEISAAKVVKQTAIPLSEEDWQLVETIAGILEPINESTLAMCSEKMPTISLMMPFFDSVLDAMSKNRDRFRNLGKRNEDADTIADGIDAAYDKLMKYFEVSSDLAILATVLDPRLKMEYYKDCENSDYIRIVEELVEQMATTLDLNSIRLDESVVVVNTTKAHLPAYLREKKGHPRYKTTTDELNQYLKESTLDADELKPLEWWKANRYS